MEKENTAAEAAPDSTGKGKILPQIGMGIVGEMIAAAITFLLLWMNESFFEKVYIESGTSVTHYFYRHQELAFVLFGLISIPCIAEFVRWGGKLLGGHRHRKRCYIGAAIGSIIALVCIFIPSFCLRNTGLKEPIQMIGVAGLLCFGLIGAIIGYRKDAK